MEVSKREKDVSRGVVELSKKDTFRELKEVFPDWNGSNECLEWNFKKYLEWMKKTHRKTRNSCQKSKDEEKSPNASVRIINRLKTKDQA